MQLLGVENNPFHLLPYRSGHAGGEAEPLPFYRAFVDRLPDAVDALFLTSDLQGREVGAGVGRLAGEAVADELADLAQSGITPPASRLGVVLAGDLYCRENPAKLGGFGDVRTVWRAFAKHAAWVVGVLGNHDGIGGKRAQRAAFARGPNWSILDVDLTTEGDSIELGGTRIAGIGGAIGDRDKKPNRRSESEFLAAVAHQLDKAPDLLVTHQHPFVSSTRRPGSVGYARLLEQHGGLVVFGHNRVEELSVRFGTNCTALGLDGRAFLLCKGPVSP